MHVRPADMHVKAQLRSFFCILNSFAVCTKDGCFAYYLGVSRKSLMYVRMYVYALQRYVCTIHLMNDTVMHHCQHT